MKNITYEVNAPVDERDLSTLFKASGIKRPSDDLPRLRSMLDHADITLTAWDNNQLVGIARAITDYSYCCYLSDLAVDSIYQQEGIGKRLVDMLREQIGEEVTLILLASPTAMEYYPKLGFEKIDNGFRVLRRR
ncbi:ribosomal protein S18 acetylase RimI-like enzyme [Evansella vedderi]|uniref:Ribosomal protein S18 acetylase RimI-like enzyme n=1 Tax=Evansella vedderi TaxID=38282 RepID=A0ABT9ZN91_9BACI|nr:GNAT family N-acetyltransferase [Evansella vedderi]MDQ0252704.1 ribosomal protein S18 acetylase RimI-like enzyme [Evansella vedderi]